MTGERDYSAIQSYFEDAFLGGPLTEQIDKVRRYYLFDRIAAMAHRHQPMLEAGCGPGQWVAWAASEGIDAIGVDWSPELIERAAAQQIPHATFLAGDLRALPLDDASVGSIMSLGAVEHAIEGPEAALSEMFRVLRPGGVALITVPYLAPVRRIMWQLTRPIRYSPRLRRALRRTRGTVRLSRDMGTRPGWTADFLATESGWSFFQYQLDKPTMRRLLTGAGFVVDEQFPFAAEEGLIQTFMPLAGRYGADGPRLWPLGRLLVRLLPAGSYEHMLGHMVHRPLTPPGSTTDTATAPATSGPEGAR